jgi:hypothetical protein
MSAIKTVNLSDGFKIEIHRSDLSNPFDDQEGVFVLDSFGRRSIRGQSADHVESLKRAKDENMHVFAVRAHTHSGEAYSLVKEDWKAKHSKPFPPAQSGQIGGRWDSGWQGYLLVSKKEHPKRAKAYEAAKGLLERYQAYVNGEGCGWHYVTPDGDIEDSRWGYYDEDSCMSEAQAAHQNRLDQEGEQLSLPLEEG